MAEEIKGAGYDAEVDVSDTKLQKKVGEVAPAFGWQRSSGEESRSLSLMQ